MEKETLTIAFDGKRAMRNLTGLGNYSRLVVESLAREYPANRHLLFSPADGSDNPRTAPLLQLPNVELCLPRGHAPGMLWRTWTMARQLRDAGVSLYHGLSNEIPLSLRSHGIPSVVTIHDVIYRRMHECYKPVDRMLYDWKYGASCRRADRVIAISDATKRDVMDFYGIPEEKIDIIYQGCADIFRHSATPEEFMKVKETYRLPDTYLVQVGTVERRKNLELAVRALSALPGHISLVAVGKGGDYRRRMDALAAELGVTDRVLFLTDVAFTHLPAIYQHALAIVYPSRYEGFGIPVLEGLESRRPVIATPLSSLPEAGGDAAFYTDPDDPRQLAAIVEAIATGSADTDAHIAAGLRHASRFANDRMASAIMATYRKVLENKPANNR